MFHQISKGSIRTFWHKTGNLLINAQSCHCLDIFTTTPPPSNNDFLWVVRYEFLVCFSLNIIMIEYLTQRCIPYETHHMSIHERKRFSYKVGWWRHQHHLPLYTHHGIKRYNNQTYFHVIYIFEKHY